MLHLGIDMLDLLIIVGTYDSAMYDVVTYNGRQAESTWRYREDLPKPRNPKRLPEGAEDYDSYVAGRSVADVFNDLINAVS